MRSEGDRLARACMCAEEETRAEVHYNDRVPCRHRRKFLAVTCERTEENQTKIDYMHGRTKKSEETHCLLLVGIDCHCRPRAYAIAAAGNFRHFIKRSSP